MATNYYQDNQELYWQNLLGGALTGGVSGSTFGPVGAGIGAAAGLGVGLVTARNTAMALEAEEERQDKLDQAISDVDSMKEFGTAAGLISRKKSEQARAQIDTESRALGITGAQKAALTQSREADIDEQRLAALSQMLPGSKMADIEKISSLLQEETVKQTLVDSSLEAAGSPMEAFGQVAGLAAALGQTKDSTTKTIGENAKVAENVTDLYGSEVFGQEGAPLTEEPMRIASGSDQIIPEEPPQQEVSPILNFADATNSEYNYQQTAGGNYQYKSPTSGKMIPVTPATNGGAAYTSIRSHHLTAYQQMYPGISEAELKAMGLM